MQFPECRHAQLLPSAAQRRCSSPKLAGLKIVAAEQCANCYCRDHEPEEASASALQLLPCACLGEARGAGGEEFDCRHPEHGRTTLQACLHCPDYLFPVVSPNMPVEMVQQVIAQPAREQHDGWWQWENVRAAHRLAASNAIDRTPTFPECFQGRGIVIVGGGRYFVSAYVTARVLRHLGCELPIELWHLEGEINSAMRELLQPLGAECRNADEVVRAEPFRFLAGHAWKGWQLKAFALRNCSFREVLLLDADSYPVRNPEFVFHWRNYREWGAVFWPDLQITPVVIPSFAWNVFGVERLSDLPTESGQLLVNKELCWRELNLALHYNAQADFVYRILYGDKDTFPIAWQRLGRRYARMWPNSQYRSVAILQFDDRGDLLFLHRVHDKFRLPETRFASTPQFWTENQLHADFPLERFCFDVLSELRHGDSLCEPSMKP